MRKGIYLIALLLSTVLTAAADGSEDEKDYNILVVQLRDGTYDTYRLDTNPKLTYEGSGMVIKSELVEARYERADVKNMNFGDEETGIRQAGMPDGFRFALNGSHVMLGGLKACTTVKVFATDGRLTGSAKASADGEASISLDVCPAGIYLISIEGRRTIKVTKR